MKGLLCRSFPINVSFCHFRSCWFSSHTAVWVGGPAQTLFHFSKSSLSCSSVNTYQMRSSMQAPTAEPAMEKEDLENEYGRTMDGKEQRRSRWSIGEKTGDSRQDPFGDEAEGDVR